jgi:hypothetical protein
MQRSALGRDMAALWGCLQTPRECVAIPEVADADHQKVALEGGRGGFGADHFGK